MRNLTSEDAASEVYKLICNMWIIIWSLTRFHRGPQILELSHMFCLPCSDPQDELGYTDTLYTPGDPFKLLDQVKEFDQFGHITTLHKTAPRNSNVK